SAQSQTMYYYYGTVSGLGPAAIPLTISDNAQVENIYTNGVFQFVSNSAQYTFSVSQPSGGAITCTVQNGSGTAPPPTSNSQGVYVGPIWITCHPSNFTPPPLPWTPLVNKA